VAVLIDPAADPTTRRRLLASLADEAATASGDVDRALDLARDWGLRLPRPGGGATVLLWEALATLGSVDLTVARTCEPHLDALAILAEHGSAAPEPGSTWGVYAAEGPGVRLSAASGQHGWLLEGTKPWCSLAGRVSHALVTAWAGEARGLFSVSLRQNGVATGSDAWVARGLPEVRSTSLTFDRVAAQPVGGPGWYLRRDGFAWGGIGVAAVWYGGAVGVARRIQAQGGRRDPDQLHLAHVGAVDTALHAARAALAEAAVLVDGGRVGGPEAALLAGRVRGVVARTVTVVLDRADRALGPGPLVSEPEHAARVADLHLYVRQHHADRDDAALGRLLGSQGHDLGGPHR